MKVDFLGNSCWLLILCQKKINVLSRANDEDASVGGPIVGAMIDLMEDPITTNHSYRILNL